MRAENPHRPWNGEPAARSGMAELPVIESVLGCSDREQCKRAANHRIERAGAPGAALADEGIEIIGGLWCGPGPCPGGFAACARRSFVALCPKTDRRFHHRHSRTVVS